MTDSHYINRLVDWIVERGASTTMRGFLEADLEFLGRRLDAVDNAGHKGAHSDVDRFDAARFLTGTYLALGDVLRLAGEVRESASPSLARVSGQARETADEGEGYPADDRHPTSTSDEDR
jgi:hypothetical protein